MPTGWFQKKQQSSGDNPPAAPVVSKVRISSLLSEETIITIEPGKTKDQIRESLVELLGKKRGIDTKTFLAKAMEREKGISTTLDTGLSLPHARMDGLENIIAALAIIPQGIADPQQTDLTIRLMLLFFSPNKQESFALHLQLLRGVSSLFQPALIDELAGSTTSAKALELIRKAEG